MRDIVGYFCCRRYSFASDGEIFTLIFHTLSHILLEQRREGSSKHCLVQEVSIARWEERLIRRNRWERSCTALLHSLNVDLHTLLFSQFDALG